MRPPTTAVRGAAELSATKRIPGAPSARVTSRAVSSERPLPGKPRIPDRYLLQGIAALSQKR